MGRSKDISQFLKGKVKAFQEEGYSQRQIAAKMKISRCAVQNSLREGGSKRKNCGRKRVTNIRQDRQIKFMVQTSPTISSANISTQLNDDLSINVSSRTIRRRLSKEMDLKARRPARKPLMTEKQRLARIRFCKTHASKSAEWWHRVMFSDESTFQQVRNCGSNYLRRPKNQRYNPKFTIKTTKHPLSIMCWGAISASGRAGLSPVERGVKINAKKYISILQEKLPIHMAIKNCSIFQQDSAPCHTAKLTKKWFLENEISVLEWPSNSPDLNVIENVWEIMKRKIAQRNPKSEADLLHIIKTVWVTEITEEYCKKLVESMPRRLEKVLKNKGYPIKY